MVRLVSGGGADDPELAGVAAEVAEQLQLEEVEFWQRRMVSLVEHCATRAHDAAHLVVLCARVLALSLRNSGYVTTCPVVVTTGGATSRVDPFLVACDMVFIRWQEALRAQFRGAGLDAERAASLASVAVAIFQGALIISRTALNTDPLEIAGVELADLVRAELSGGSVVPC